MQKFDDNSASGTAYMSRDGYSELSEAVLAGRGNTASYTAGVLYPGAIPNSIPYGSPGTALPLPARMSPIQVPTPPTDFWHVVAQRTAEILAGRV